MSNDEKWVLRSQLEEKEIFLYIFVAFDRNSTQTNFSLFLGANELFIIMFNKLFHLKFSRK